MTRPSLRKLEIPGANRNKMADAAVFAKSSNRYNSTTYQPISMKLETQTQNDMSILASYQPEVQTGSKMAAAAIFVYPSKRI